MLKLKKRNLLYLTAYTAYFSGLVIERTSAAYAPDIKSALVLIAGICLIYNYLKNGFIRLKSNQKKLGVLLLVIVVFLLALVSRDFFILMLILFGINSGNLNDDIIDGIFKWSIMLSIGIAVCAICACILGIIPNINTPRTYGASSRLSWGFEHSQTFSLLMLYVVLYYYVYKRKLTLLNFCFVQIITIVIAIFFDAKNALYSTEIFYMFLFIWKLTGLFSKKLKRNASIFVGMISIISMGLIGTLSILLLILYKNGNSLALTLDTFFTGRISLALRTFSINPFVFIKVMTFEEYRSMLVSTMDNGFYYILMRYGVFYLIILVIVSGIVGSYFKKRNNLYGCIALIAIAISCSISNAIVGFYFFPFWIIGMNEIHNWIGDHKFGLKTRDLRRKDETINIDSGSCL